MLPAAARLRARADFTDTVRRGRGARAGALVVTLLQATPGQDPAPARIGFVVGRRVGGAVVRNRVRRRLRHLVAARTGSLTTGSRVVVRALPGAADRPSQALGADLDLALARLVRP